MHRTGSSRHIHSRPRSAAAAVLLLALAGLGLAACGGSSSSTNASASATTASTSTGGAGGPGRGRFAALRSCLQKNGITLPRRTPGARRPPGVGGFGAFGGAGGGLRLPSGVSRAQFQAALKKCGGTGFGGAGRFNNPAYRQALATFATCMRQNGVNLPEPNTSGNGPVFSVKGIDTATPQFKAAMARCRSDLSGAFRGGPPPSG
jgi:hypothetical protein